MCCWFRRWRAGDELAPGFMRSLRSSLECACRAPRWRRDGCRVPVPAFSTASPPRCLEGKDKDGCDGVADGSLGNMRSPVMTYLSERCKPPGNDSKSTSSAPLAWISGDAAIKASISTSGAAEPKGSSLLPIGFSSGRLKVETKSSSFGRGLLDLKKTPLVSASSSPTFSSRRGSLTSRKSMAGSKTPTPRVLERPFQRSKR
mmetsp:Transcript_92439/g.166967  ORF Transcript_92439/g.166967 Transcript_92439/m.166967 type:complete len:202 (+) Transcript_92439:304-909(+)